MPKSKGLSSSKVTGVSKKSKAASPSPSISAAVLAALVAIGIGTDLNQLVGRKVDVPNAFWGKSWDDGALYPGTINKVQFMKGAQGGEKTWACNVKFAGTKEKYGFSNWIELETIAGQAAYGKKKQSCKVHDAAPPPPPKPKQPSAAGKRKAAAPADRDEDDLGDELRWAEGFDTSVPIPPNSDARGGIKQELPANPTALDFHKLTCPAEVYELVLKQTLRQAEACDFDWRKTDPGEKAGPKGEPTLQEIKVFFAVTMYMSIVKITVLHEYWDEGKYGQDLVKRHFTRKRFEAILSNLHFADPEDRPAPMVSMPRPPTPTRARIPPPSSMRHHSPHWYRSVAAWQEGSEKLNPADRNWKMAEVQKLFTNAWCRAGAYTQFLAMDECVPPSLPLP